MKKSPSNSKKSGDTHPADKFVLKYRKCLVKISGEVLGNPESPFDLKAFKYATTQLIQAHQYGACIGVVVGGGNIIRGRSTSWIEKVDADTCGMMATIINGIILHSHMRERGARVKMSSGIAVSGVVDRCNKFEEKTFYDERGILIFVGGTGNPLFTTDTAAALRASEFGADILIKATKVKGVFSADPDKNPKAEFYRRLSFDDAIRQNLSVMDLAAFNICRESRIPICVYDYARHSLSNILQGEDIGTLVS